MGEEFVRQFAKEGAFVTFCDVNDARGKNIEVELNKDEVKVKFVKCNVTDWNDQVRMFDTAIESSPHRSCDVVIANAGISRSSGDSLWKLDG